MDRRARLKRPVMRLARMLTQTLREAPAGTELPGQQYLIRAGYLQPLAAGLATALPLANLVLRRLSQRVETEFDLPAALEVRPPLVRPAERSGAAVFTDRNDRALALSDATIPALAAVVGAHLRSYRQLPLRLFTSGAAWLDLPRPRAGWLQDRLDEIVTIVDLVSGADALDDAAQTLSARTTALLANVGLPTLRVEAQPSSWAQDATAWLFLYPEGEQAALVCHQCGYAAEAEAAHFARSVPPEEPPLPMKKVATPHCPTIDSLAEFLHLPASRTAKVVFLAANNRLHFIILRGDREVNEARLKAVLGADPLRPATDAEIKAAGAVPGYASLVGLADVYGIVDLEIPALPNLVAGANEAGYHLINVNYGRDYRAARVEDIALARAGDGCPCCGSPLREVHGSAVARVETIAGLPECHFLAEDGSARPVMLAQTQIRLHRLLAALAETYHDERGLTWPPTVAPFQVHMVLLTGKTGQPQAVAEQIYTRLAAQGIPALLDDRADSAGVKFNDADLIGLPLRFTISDRSLTQGGVEVRRRGESESRILSIDDALTVVANLPAV